MKIKSCNQRVTDPTVFVTKGRQRVKQYDNFIVYLKNGEEFEIELFNPTFKKVLAKIKLNGISLGSGIILRPGERVFLERYFDEAKKFLFETYEVDADDKNVKRAIQNNGIVDVEFYDEWALPMSYCNTITYYNNSSFNYIIDYPVSYKEYPYNNYIGTTLNVSNDIDSGSMKIGNAGSREINAVNCSSEIPQTEETGRVEKGSNSDQSFVYDHTTFYSYYSWNRKWTILPESKKPYVIEDLSVFCTNCGAKRKKTGHKFCPICGNKF